MIVSVSRRTDIPAFYSQWFMNRLAAGFAMTRNPFNARQVSRIELTPEAVSLLVFWTRNPLPLLPYLSQLDAMGYRYYFHVTLTGYPKALGVNVFIPEALAQRLLDDGWLTAPGCLFHPDRQPSTRMRINFATAQDAAFWRDFENERDAMRR